MCNSLITKQAHTASLGTFNVFLDCSFVKQIQIKGSPWVPKIWCVSQVRKISTFHCVAIPFFLTISVSRFLVYQVPGFDFDIMASVIGNCNRKGRDTKGKDLFEVRALLSTHIWVMYPGNDITRW